MNISNNLFKKIYPEYSEYEIEKIIVDGKTLKIIPYYNEPITTSICSLKDILKNFIFNNGYTFSITINNDTTIECKIIPKVKREDNEQYFTFTNKKEEDTLLEASEFIIKGM